MIILNKMGKDLLKKIVVGGMIVGAGLGLISCQTYEIDGNTVKDSLFGINDIVEYKGEDIIKYSSNKIFGPGELDKVTINGKKYDGKNVLIYQEALKRYNYLLQKIDSTDKANYDLEMQEKLAKEKERQERDLEVLRR